MLDLSYKVFTQSSIIPFLYYEHVRGMANAQKVDGSIWYVCAMCWRGEREKGNTF